MRRIVLLLASAELTVLFILAITGCSTTAPKTSPIKPNFVFILTDDMRKDDLKYMPKTRSLLETHGMQFDNAFVSNPLCCPSRATIMRASTLITRGFGITQRVPMGGGRATRTTATSKTT